jgi:glutathione S-transferase
MIFKDVLRRELFIPTVEKNFPIYVHLLKQSPSGFFGKSGFSWVDLVIAEYMTTIRFYEPLIMEKYPVITRFIDKVQQLPPIKDYIKQRAKTPLQLQYL